MSRETEQIRRAFVLMPFDQEFDAIFKELIKPALEGAGYEVKRADSILNQQNILKDVVRGIEEADLVVADLTSLNANVFYELGISHTMQKPTVLLAQSGEDIPFDLKSYRVISYSTHFNEARQLSQALKDMGEKAKSGKLRFGNPVADFLPHMEVVKFPQATKVEECVIETEDERKVKTEEAEKGIWDFVVDGEKSIEDITKCIERIIKATQEIGEKMQKRTEDVQKITQSGARGTASQVHKLAAEVAMDMIKHAEKLEEEQPKLHNAWESFNESTIGLVQTTRLHTKEDKEAALDFRSSVDKMRLGVRSALEGMQRYREAVVGVKGISRDVNRASKRTTRILDLLISDIEGADSFCTKVVTLLDEKIENEG